MSNKNLGYLNCRPIIEVDRKTIDQGDKGDKEGFWWKRGVAMYNGGG